eukprot:12552775-Prorocentrum_lima.AAC.1
MEAHNAITSFAPLLAQNARVALRSMLVKSGNPRSVLQNRPVGVADRKRSSEATRFMGERL